MLSNFALGYGLILGEYDCDSYGWKHGRAVDAHRRAMVGSVQGAVSGKYSVIGPGDQGGGDSPDGDPLRGLTAKQCEVLDLLIQHKTSKEISRLLGISPHTVDQRIMLARAKLQVASRNEVAQAYRRLRDERGGISDPDIYDRSVYGSPDVAESPEISHNDHREGAAVAPSTDQETGPDVPAPWDPMPRQMAGVPSGDAARGYYHVLPEAFDGRGGTLLRLGAIAMIAVFFTLVILGGLAMYSELSHMLDG
jgi:DNA-binding CsgD family transcriptional regulator